jgi:hypothetical protein
VGTISSGTWNGSVIGLTYGGTNAALTASNGGIVYSTASALAILGGTATANLPLLSGTSTTPTWGAYTLPATITANCLLYGSSTSALTTLATSNSSVLTTSAGGVPQWAAASSIAIISVSGTAGQITSSTTSGAVTLNLTSGIITAGAYSNPSSVTTDTYGRVTTISSYTSAPVLTGGSTMTGLLTLSADPSSALNAATKQYVDAVPAQLNCKNSCYCVTTANLTATYNNGTSGVGATLTNSGAQAAFSVDGVSPAVNARVLVTGQSTTFQNGLYTLTTVGSGVANWVLTRATDYNVVAEINVGDIVHVTNGTAYASTIWQQTTTMVTIGTTAITFSQFSASGTGAIYLQKSSNLSDLANTTTARTNLGLTAVATQTTTQYNTLVGGASNAIVNIATGTSGQLLTSNGAAANPSYTTYTGSSSVVTVGTISSGTWNGNVVSLTYGGTNAALTASNGGIVYSGASALAILSGTATANKALLSGLSTAPTWSAYTLPASITANCLLYGSSTTALTTLATSNSSVLTTSAGGVPQWVAASTIAVTSVSGTGGQITASTTSGAVTVGLASGIVTANTYAYPSSVTVDTYGRITSITASTAPVLLSGSTMTGLLTLSADPSSALHAATKEYVDYVPAQSNYKNACVCVSASNLTATYANGTNGVGATLTNSDVQAAFSADGVSPAVNERVLVAGQTTASQNGIYTLTTVGSGATNWVLTRAADYNTLTVSGTSISQINVGDITPIISGTAYANTLWQQTTAVVAIGTTAITFSQFVASGTGDVYLIKTNNLSDLSNAVTARSNLGLTAVATQTLTQYYTLVGGASNSIVSVATGTSGQLLTSNGSSANPSYTTYTGSSSVVTVGTITSGTWNGSVIGLTYGGTNANLTASNGGIIYSTASAMAVLAGTATANKVLLSGLSTAPTWSAYTLPASITANCLLYGSSTTALTTLATSNSSVLTTSAGGVPQWAAASSIAIVSVTGTSGQISASTTTGAVTVGLASGVVTANTYAYPSSVTVDTYGRITAITASTAPVLLSGSTMTGLLFLSADPSSALGAVTKQYVDGLFATSTYINSCTCITTANLTATYNNGTSGVGATLTNSGTQAAFSSDGVSPAVNSRILVANQTTQAQNGVYTLTTVGSGASNWVLTRATDYNSLSVNGVSQITVGDLIPVINGTIYGNTLWKQTSTVVTIGTTAIVFSQFAATGTGTIYLQKASNLSDLASAATARTNLGLTSVATQTTTQYNTLVGGASNAIVNIATGTSGQLLTSNGAAANPSYTTYTGTSSVVTVGTITSGTWNGSVIGLTYGGTNAALTASTGGIVYSGASALAILAGNATANLPLLSGSSAAPSWSSYSFPSTVATNNILYASSSSALTASSTLPAAVQQNITNLGAIVPTSSTSFYTISAAGTVQNSSSNLMYGIYLSSTIAPNVSGVTGMYGVASVPVINAGAYTITNAACYFASPSMGSNAGTITNLYGFYYNGGVTGTGITNTYGIYINASSFGTNNYAAYFGGTVCVGGTSSSASLYVNSSTSYIFGMQITGTVGSTNTSAGLYLSTTMNMGATYNAVGANISPIFTLTANANTAYSVYHSPTVNGAFLLGNLYGMYLTGASVTSATIDRSVNLYVLPIAGGTKTATALFQGMTYMGNVSISDVYAPSGTLYISYYTSSNIIRVDGTINTYTGTGGNAFAYYNTYQFTTPSASGSCYGTYTTTTLTMSFNTAAMYGMYYKPTIAGAFTLTNSYGIYIDSVTSTATAVTNTYGIYVTASTVGTNNYGAYIGGFTGINITPTTPLDVFSLASTTSYTNVVRIACTTGAGISNFSRMLMGQYSSNQMFLEAADQSNTKGTLWLQPYGGTVAVGTTLDMKNNPIANVSNPTNQQDAVTKNYLATFVPTVVAIVPVGTANNNGAAGSTFTGQNGWGCNTSGTTTNNMILFTNNPLYELQMSPAATNNYITYNFGTLSSGTYLLTYSIGYYSDRPQISVSETTTGASIRSAIDAYSPGRFFVTFNDYFYFNPGGGSGNMTVKWLITGKISSSTNYYLLLTNYIQLTRMYG